MGAFDDIISFAATNANAMPGTVAGPAAAMFFSSLIPPQRTAPPPSPPGSFPERYAKADAQMKAKGITDEQAAAYRPINKFIRAGINPFGYGLSTARILSSPEQAFAQPLTPGERAAHSGMYKTGGAIDHRQDAWRLYLGMPQTNNTFSVSPYQPSTSKDPGAVYYKINDFWQRMAGDLRKNMLTDLTEPELEARKALDDYQNLTLFSTIGDRVDDQSAVMGEYKLGRGQDERGPYLSYYDSWDLDQDPVEGATGRFGKPFEIYDRLYIDPATKSIQWGGPKQGTK